MQRSKKLSCRRDKHSAQVLGPLVRYLEHLMGKLFLTADVTLALTRHCIFAQVWTSCASSWSAVAKAVPASIVMRTQPMGAHLSDPLLAPFRSSRCLSKHHLHPVGRVHAGFWLISWPHSSLHQPTAGPSLNALDGQQAVSDAQSDLRKSLACHSDGLIPLC